jgi:hypothetical protein
MSDCEGSLSHVHTSFSLCKVTHRLPGSRQGKQYSVDEQKLPQGGAGLDKNTNRKHSVVNRDN